MYEIEIKAHVYDRKAVSDALASFAEYEGSIKKHDTYYRYYYNRASSGCSSASGSVASSEGISLSGATSPSGNASPSGSLPQKPYLTARIRREAITTANAESRTEILLTYKRKETRTLQDGTSSEVNEENECALSDALAIEKLFADIGFKPSYTKEKFAESWYAQTPAGQAHIELCEVPPLGDFLEIEIMAQNNDSATVDATRKELYKLLEKCGVDKSAIETRYYSELLPK